jgi:hypothetical protein
MPKNSFHAPPKSQAPSICSGLADTKRRSPINFYDKPIHSVVKNLRYKSSDPRRVRESNPSG